jgi:hypothetical protein
MYKNGKFCNSGIFVYIKIVSPSALDKGSLEGRISEKSMP